MKRWHAYLAGAVIVLALGVAVFFIAGDSDQAYATAPGRYLTRDLLIPAQDYVLPDVQNEILTPQIRSLVDPDQALDRQTLENVKLDTLTRLHQHLDQTADRAVEDALFDD